LLKKRHMIFERSLKVRCRSTKIFYSLIKVKNFIQSLNSKLLRCKISQIDKSTFKGRMLAVWNLEMSIVHL